MSDGNYGRVGSSSNSSPAKRRKFLKTVAGSMTTVGMAGAATTNVAAHHTEDPDWRFEVKSESCNYYGEELHGVLNVDTYYRGYDDDRHKYEWVTAIGSSSAAYDGDGDLFYDIQRANCNIQWDDDQYDYPVVDPDPVGYDPTVYAYQETTDPDDGEDIAEQAAEGAASYLVGQVPFGDLVWTGGELVYNMVSEDEDATWYDGEYDIWFDFGDWAPALRAEQGHYDWIYHVYLDGYDYMTLNITDTIYGYSNDIGSEIEVTYWTDEYGAHVSHDVVGKISNC